MSKSLGNWIWRESTREPTKLALSPSTHLHSQKYGLKPSSHLAILHKHIYFIENLCSCNHALIAKVETRILPKFALEWFSGESLEKFLYPGKLITPEKELIQEQTQGKLKKELRKTRRKQKCRKNEIYWKFNKSNDTDLIFYLIF